MTRRWLVGVVVTAALSLAGCATIFSGTTEEVSFESTPKASLTITPQKQSIPVWEGETPATVELKRKYRYEATLSVPGYEDTRVLIDKDFNGLVLCNIACGGIIGGAVDALTGAFWDLDPTQVHVKLVQASAPPTPTAPDAVPPPAEATAPGGADGALYALFVTRDAEGQPHSVAVPLVRKAL